MIDNIMKDFVNDGDELLWNEAKKFMIFPDENTAQLNQQDLLFWLKRAVIRKNCYMVSYNKINDSYDDLGYSYITNSENESKANALPLVTVGQKPCLFLDRDGVINEDAGYIFKQEDIVWRADIFDTLRKINALGIQIVIVTNQSGIGRGYYTEDDVLTLHKWMNDEFVCNGVKVDRWYYCPHHPEAIEERYRKASLLRKPNSAMAELAFSDLDIDPARSLMIGDKLSDKLNNLDLETWFIKGQYELGNGKIIESIKEVLGYFSKA
jgi:D-glycero-D-manno-heptose 1,7-bisphosphate phosphatase